PKVGSVPQEPLELRDVLAGHQGDVPDAGAGEGADGVEDHRLVEHVEQVLVHDLGDGVEAGPEPTGEHDAFHGITLTYASIASRQGRSATPQAAALEQSRTPLAGRRAIGPPSAPPRGLPRGPARPAS